MTLCGIDQSLVNLVPRYNQIPHNASQRSDARSGPPLAAAGNSGLALFISKQTTVEHGNALETQAGSVLTPVPSGGRARKFDMEDRKP